MKNKKTRTQIFHSRLAAYSVTATAALLAAPAAADAEIQNITTFSINGGPQTITAPYIGQPDTQSAATQGRMQTFLAGAFHGSLKLGTGQWFGFFYRNHTGNTYQIGGNIAINSGGQASLLNPADALTGKNFQTGAHAIDGNSLSNSHNYVGFKVINSRGTYYGWLRVSAGESHGIGLVAGGRDLTIYGAYDLKSNIAADGFMVGQFNPAPAPEPSIAAIGGLGLLALGAIGVRELRRRRQAEAKTN